jgi:hypothetical protein
MRTEDNFNLEAGLLGTPPTPLLPLQSTATLVATPGKNMLILFPERVGSPGDLLPSTGDGEKGEAPFLP